MKKNVLTDAEFKAMEMRLAGKILLPIFNGLLIGDLLFHDAKLPNKFFGKETSCTYHHQIKDDMPFFIDFTFTNIPLFAYMIGGWERNMSDHCSQIIVM